MSAHVLFRFTSHPVVDVYLIKGQLRDSTVLGSMIVPAPVKNELLMKTSHRVVVMIK